jgi:4-hydroxy-tetrahydrodipicolinate synthase
MEVIRRTVARVKGRVQVIAGTGSNSTHEAVALSQAAEKAGADAVMVVVPYYNRPTQEGLVVHFQTVAAAINLPVVLYNIPGRTGTDLSADTVARLCELSPNIVGIKEATGNVLRAQELKRRLGNRLTVLSGDDALTLPMIAVGASGVISVTSNLLPEAVGNATRLALDGKFLEAQSAHFALLPVHESMFVEANPGPVKAALADMGLAIDAVRSPLVAASDKSRQTVRQALASYKSGK